MKNIYRYYPVLFFYVSLLFLLSACGNGSQPDQAEITPFPANFQAQTSPIPTIAPYRCGAWSSTNTPGVQSTVTIYAKVTSDVQGIPNVPASAIVHFRSQDVTLSGQTASDKNGYVHFDLPLHGRQPYLTPATVDVTFQIKGQAVSCSAFFTPL